MIKKIKNICDKSSICVLISSIIISAAAFADGFPRLNPNNTNDTAPTIGEKPNVTHDANKKAHSQQETSLNKIVAIVNNDVITQLELEQKVSQVKVALMQAGIPIPDKIILEKQVLNKLILQKLELSLAKKNGISASSTEVNQALNQIAMQNKVTIDKMKSSIISQYGSMKEYKKTLHQEVIIRKLKQQAVASNNIQITPKEIQTFLQKQEQSQKQHVQYQVAHILIPQPAEPTPENIKQTKEKAQKIRKKIEAGMSFTKAAASYSGSSDAMKGGILPWKTLGELPDLFQIVQNMKKNQVSKLIRSPGGFNIIKLIGKRDQPIPKIFINEYDIQQIVINTSPVVTNLDAKARLLRIRDTLVNSKESFDSLSKSNSDDHKTSEKEGKLGWLSIDEINAINPKMAEVASSLKLNQISEPFESDKKWYLIKLIGKKKIDNTSELQKQHAQQVIFQKKAMKALDTWESELKGNSYINILDPKLK
jgi:peptidyl-prolyl cis-trans isomerase SurA